MQFSSLHVYSREKVNFQRYQAEVEKMKWRSNELELEKRELTLTFFQNARGVGINFIYTYRVNSESELI